MGRLVMPECDGYPHLAELVRRCPGGDAVELHDGPCTTSSQLAERIRGARTVLHFFNGRPLDADVLRGERPQQVVVAGPAARWSTSTPPGPPASPSTTSPAWPPIPWPSSP
ncbi:hypothetical protein O1L55_17895 [Streptomyces albulus]|nr:hypothetical protein [Streptomyces noursei]